MQEYSVCISYRIPLCFEDCHYITQKIEFGIVCPDTDTDAEKKNRHRRLLEASKRRFLSANQWLNSFCSISRRIGLYCSVKGNSAELGKTVSILGKRIGVDAEIHPCDVYGANIVINFVYEGRKFQLRRLELSRSFTVPIPYLSFVFLGVSAGMQIGRDWGSKSCAIFFFFLSCLHLVSYRLL